MPASKKGVIPSQALEDLDDIYSEADENWAVMVAAMYPNLQPGNLKIGKPPKKKADLHYGPGAHPSGSPQSVHGERGGVVTRAKKKSKFVQEYERKNARDKKNRIATEALSKKYPGIKFHYNREDKTSLVGDQYYYTLASYNTKTNEVITYPNTFDESGKPKPGVIEHEINHFKYDSIYEQKDREYDQMLKLYRESSIPLIKSDGTIEPGFEDLFPAHDFHNKYFYKAADLDRMHELGGVTDYSQSFWDEMPSMEVAAPRQKKRAYEETLAEIAHLDAMGEGDKVPALWRSIYEDLEKTYAKI